MLVLALDAAGAEIFRDKEKYLELIEAEVKKAEKSSGKKADLLVFPAFWALYLAASWGFLAKNNSFDVSHQDYLHLCRRGSWIETFLSLQGQLAKRLNAYLVSGTYYEFDLKGRMFHSAGLLDPSGRLIGSQRQTHLSREERNHGLARGEDILIFSIKEACLGIIVGTDARYPEVGRILALQGADLVCHCGAIVGGSPRFQQLAGIWSQAQQNQFFAVESQLQGCIGGRKFSGESFVHAPCEMTPGKKGFIPQDDNNSFLIWGQLDFPGRQIVVRDYPLLKFLNTEACHNHLPCLLLEKGRAKGESP